MISYLDNVDGMSQAINAKRAKYAREQQKKDKHGIVDLTGLNNNLQQPSGKTLRGTIGNSRSNQPVFTTIKEDRGGGVVPNYQNMEDEYTKYDSMWDGSADQQLINSGATILHSHIEISDSSGRNRIVVRRNDSSSE